MKRLEWDKAKEKESREAADMLEAERLAMQSIDWCDAPLPPHPWALLQDSNTTHTPTGPSAGNIARNVRKIGVKIVRLVGAS